MIDDQLLFYRNEALRLAARNKELRSSFSYRLVAPVRLIERGVRSIRKRSLRDSALRIFENCRRLLRLKSEPRSSIYQRWIDRFDKLRPDDLLRMRSEIESLKFKPLVSIVVLPSPDDGGTTGRSIERQIYRSFEIIAVASENGAPSAALASARPAKTAPNGSAGQHFNAALQEAQGEFCIALEAGDALAPDALFLLVRALNEHRDADIVYGDEDDLEESGNRANPFFKPEWNALLALSFDYVGRAALYRTAKLRELNGARPEAGDAWRWDLLLRATDGGAAGLRSVKRVPYIVLYRRCGSAKPRLSELRSGKAVVEEMLAAQGRPSSVTIDESGWLVVSPEVAASSPAVAIVIPMRDRHALLKRCVDSILRRTTYRRFHIYVINNDSTERRTLAYLDEVRSHPQVTVIDYPREFNYAALHNAVVPQTEGELLAFVNSDIEVDSPAWLDQMVGFAMQPDIGIVGAKLYYPNETVQHAGVVLDEAVVASHVFLFSRRKDPGPRGLLRISRDMSAVTAACMAMRRSVFDEVDGFDEAYKVDLNDIDLCLRVGQQGYRIVWAAQAELYHLESATRTKVRGVEGQLQLQREFRTFRSKWADRTAEDPYYSPNMAIPSIGVAAAFPPRVLKLKPDPRRSRAPQRKKGVAIHGLFHAETGLGQAARGVAEAFTASGVPFSCHAIQGVSGFANPVPYVCSEKLNSDFEKALVVLNPESLLGTKALLPIAGMHRIGFWHWELPVFPPRWSAAFDFVDELWAPSRFVAELLRCATSKPVSIMPHAVTGSAVEKEVARRTLGIPDDAFVFLTIFDGRSYVTRKNPEAAVRAFRDAFPQDGGEKVALIVKYHCVPGSTNPAEGLCPVIAGDRRVQLINQVFSKEEMAALTSAADVFVSLHRSEGFGLNIAEAMATGRLAVATDFSGNTDFMNEANSLLVPYTMRAVQPGEYPLGAGQWWAEPDHEAAVEAFRTAFHDPERRCRLAQKAKEDMAANHSPKAIGRRIAAALDWPATGG